MLRVELPETYINYFGGKMAILGQMFVNHGAENVPDLFDKDLGISDIPDKYITTKGNISLMSPGKLQEVNEASACPFNVVMIRFLPHLKLKDDEIVLMDMEAGIEHFARGTDDFIDAVVMVVDPTYESIQLSKKIHDMAGGINKPVYYSQ